MKIKKFSKKPLNIKDRIGASPIVCYPSDNFENNLKVLHEARKHLKKLDEVMIAPRDAKTFKVKSGNFFRI